jgi:hypothetical protein
MTEQNISKETAEKIIKQIGANYHTFICWNWSYLLDSLYLCSALALIIPLFIAIKQSGLIIPTPVVIVFSIIYSISVAVFMLTVAETLNMKIFFYFRDLSKSKEVKNNAKNNCL